MALPFVRSIRALQGDREWPALLVLGTAMLLVGLWAYWFLRVPIAVYATGEAVQLTSRNQVVALFPPQAAARLRPGQSAYLTARDAADQPALPAQVLEVDAPSGAAGQVLLDPLANGVTALFAPGAGPVTVAVEVEQLTPVQLVGRAAGQSAASDPVQLRP